MCLFSAFEAHVTAASTEAPDDTRLSVSRASEGFVYVDVMGPTFHDASDHAITLIDRCGKTMLEDAEGAVESNYLHGQVLRSDDGVPAGYRCIFELSPCAYDHRPAA